MPALDDNLVDGGVTTVLVVAANAVARAAVAGLVAADPGLELAAQADSVDRALFELRSLSPRVAVLVDDDGDAIRELVEQGGGVPLLLVASRDDPDAVSAALDAGARGYVLFGPEHGELGAAIRDLAAGGTYVDPELGAGLIAAEATARRRDAETPLSARELEVLRLLALGYGNREAAAELFVSPRTVETHRARIMHKLGLGTRAELVGYALEHGVVDTRPAPPWAAPAPG